MKKRIIAMCCAFILTFTTVVARCFYVSQSKAYTVSDTYNSYKINISTLYKSIYDRNGELLNNNTKSLLAIIRPNEKCLSELDLLFNSDEIKQITDELSDGYPIVRKIEKYAKTNYIKLLEVVNENNSDMLCRHLIDKQYGGLEEYTDEITGTLSVNFSVDALGRILSGDDGQIINDNYELDDGVTISIDSQIQKIAEDESKTIPKGSVVVMDVNTSQILACVSRGDDYVNRALSSYAVGSIFKLVVCVSAIENNVNLLFNCKSTTTVGDTEFSCQNGTKHGLQSMKTALANSCNCYFVNLALKLGADNLYNTARELGFSSTFKLYDGWSLKAGVFASRETLKSLGQLALIGFGQGELTDLPVHFASVISCIANGGHYNYPTLKVSDVISTRAISEKTCDKIKEYMKYVVTDGTGKNANYENSTAGKTATAQSGIYENGNEILNTWFAGFYPYSNPKYAIVVMQEDGQSGAGDCCPVFYRIVEKLSAL